jgi:hypothetical protein
MLMRNESISDSLVAMLGSCSSSPRHLAPPGALIEAKRVVEAILVSMLQILLDFRIFCISECECMYGEIVGFYLLRVQICEGVCM